MHKSFFKSVSVFYLAALLLFTSCGGTYKAVQKSVDPQLKYNAAMAYYKAGQYIKALPLFEELLTVFRGTEKAQDLYYYYAYSNYYLGDYVMAQFYFGNYYHSYPHTDHAEECEFMRAYCDYLLSPVFSLDQTDTKKAIEAFQTFVDDNPNSARVKEANKYIDLLRAKLEKKYFEIAKQYYTIEYYNAASTALNLYIRQYPDSKYVEEANFLIIKSDYLYAYNSVTKQKNVRFQKVVNEYTKFAAAFPKSEYLKEAQNYYKNAKNSIQ
jgi:outer membrane protein assembly factor BamD